jgi:hypothetical protein
MTGVNTDRIAQLVRIGEDGAGITREEYEHRVRHDYAGPGTPCDPSAPGYWTMAMDDDGATCLWTGLRIIETRLKGPDEWGI